MLWTYLVSRKKTSAYTSCNDVLRESLVRQQKWHVVRTDKKNLTTSIGDVMYKKTMLKKQEEEDRSGQNISNEHRLRYLHR